jgi:hypothetical protein
MPSARAAPGSLAVRASHQALRIPIAIPYLDGIFMDAS